MEKILLARVSVFSSTGKRHLTRIFQSYVLYQERNVLFNPKTNTGVQGSSGLTRTATRKSSSSRPTAKPAQPLVNMAGNDVFEPGSLLRNA